MLRYGLTIGEGSQDTRYLVADDQVVTRKYENLEFIVRMLLEEYEKWSFKIN